MDIGNQEFEVLIGNKSTKEELVVEAVRESREEALESLRNNNKLHELKDGPLIDFMHEVKGALIARNKELGIKTPQYDLNVFIAEKNYFPSVPEGTDVHGMVQANANAIIIWDFGVDNQIDDNVSQEEKELVLFNQAVTLGHELYHAFSPLKYVSRKVNDRSINVNPWRRGFYYWHNNSEKSLPEKSLEEGLAKIWENGVRIKARKFFSGGAELSDRLKTIIGRKHDKQVDKIIVFRYDKKTGVARYCDDRYLNSERLVKYLIDNVPNFQILAERARINGKVDELAVAIEDKFGVGTYSELTEVKEDGALDYLYKLQDREIK